MKLEKTPFLATHVNGDVAWIDVLFVPEERRHQGFGRRMILEWVRKLPETIKKIELLAVDLDGGSPVGFWKKLGFEIDEVYFPELLTGCYMVQKVREDPNAPAEPSQPAKADRPSDESWCAPA